MDKIGVLRFVSDGEKAVEAETGVGINESINKATNLAIQAAVVNTVREGARKGHWSYKEDQPMGSIQHQILQTQPATQSAVPQEQTAERKVERRVEVATPEPKPEVKVESKPEPKPEATPKTKTATTKVNVRETDAKEATIVAVLGKGEVVEVVEEKGSTVLVKTKNNKEGWVSKEFLK